MGRKRSSQTSLPSRWALKHGAYYYRVPPGLEPEWDDKKWFLLGKTLAEAYATWYTRVQVEDGAPSTIGVAMDRYCSEVLPSKAPKTQSEYLKAINRLRGVFGQMSPKALKPRHVYQYMDKRPPTAGNREKATLSAIMTACVRWGALDRNIVREVKRNVERPRDRYVTDEEVEAFLSHCGSLLKAYVDLKLLTGLRQGQILNLKLSDWDGERLTVPAAKGGRTVVYSGDGLKGAVEDSFAIRKGRALRSLYIFSTRTGQHYSGDGFRSIWQRAMHKYIAAGNERFTDHDLRAKVASDSASLSDAQNRLGHQSSQLTQRVYRRKPSEVSVLKRTPKPSNEEK
jgi:integrase